MLLPLKKRKQTYKLFRDAPITLLSALNLLFTVTFPEPVLFDEKGAF